MAAGITSLCKNNELPKPAASVTVPEAEATLPPISWSRMFWVRRILEKPVVEMMKLLAPVESPMPAPAESTILPVLEAKPLAETAFNPETETVMLPAPVAV